MKFNYFYGNQAEQYQFVTIPKLMLFDEKFAALSLTAKVLYGLLLDRTGLSRKNKWLDEQNRVYIIYAIADIQQDLGLTKRKAMESLGELEKFGLVEKKRRGFGLPSILYVKHFYEVQSAENRSAESATTEPDCGVRNSTPEVAIESTSEVSPEALQNNTKYNNTYMSKPIYPSEEMDEMDGMRELLKENIEYDVLMTDNELPKDMLEEIVNLLEDTLQSRVPEVRIGSAVYPREVVRSRILKLNSEHIKYVIYSLKRNRTEVKNIRAYLLTALYNAPATMGSYYTAMVAHHTYGDGDE